jgi:hypothetical protein
MKLIDTSVSLGEFGSTDGSRHRYFQAFGMAAGLERERVRAS